MFTRIEWKSLWLSNKGNRFLYSSLGCKLEFKLSTKNRRYTQLLAWIGELYSVIVAFSSAHQLRRKLLGVYQ